jgi:CheY-like chemotaxis protein
MLAGEARYTACMVQPSMTTGASVWMGNSRTNISYRCIDKRARTWSNAAPGQPGRVGREEPPNAMWAPSRRSAEHALQGLRVVLVEDDDDGRELVSLILRNAGASVESVASAAAGFDAICHNRPQMLVSDIGMPDEDGYTLMRRVRALESCEGGDVPAIALSAFTRPEDRMQALRAGFTMHLGKPIHPIDLVSAMAQLAALMWRREPWPLA